MFCIINFGGLPNCFAAIRSPRNNNDIIITKADKSSQVGLHNQNEFYFR